MDPTPPCIVLEQLSKDESAKITLNLGEVEDTSERNFLVGRTPECELCLVSTQYPLFISRQHARISLIETEIFVTDLKSVNGTFVNDIMLQPMVKTNIKLGDFVTFGCISPEEEIVPGNIAKQDDPIFKFLLKETRDLKLSDINPDQAKRDTILPLTVKNLIAFSGCTFSSDDKENGDEAKKPREKKKRKKTLYYSKRRRPKPSTESCEFFDCKISQIKQDGVVSWVQCDGCDKWFHTDCIGCDYNSVRSDGTQFHCGQC